jgi:opacity protein-like surface antigen
MKILFAATLLLALSACAYAQKDYVGRYDVFAGYSYLNSPKLNLQQRGFNTQIGVNVRRWLSFGVDYSIQFGRASLGPADLKPVYQNELAGLAAQLQIPPATLAAVSVPFDATTQTYTVGPQLAYRHFQKMTLFVHPSIGAMHENISLNANNALTSGILAAITTPPPYGLGVLKTTRPNDTTYFYGFGGGADYNATKHFHVRADVEFVHVNLFSNTLKDSRNSVRLSVGPTFNFGKNVTR